MRPAGRPGGRRRSARKRSTSIPTWASSRDFAAAVAKRLLGRLRGPARGRVDLDLERAQPLAVPEAGRALAGHLPRDGRAGAAADPGGERQCARPGGRDRRGRQPRDGDRAARVRAALAVPRRSVPAGADRQVPDFEPLELDGYAHHPYGPAQRVPRKKDIVSLLVIRRLGALSGRRRAGWAAVSRPPHLQHRVRAAEQPARPHRRHLAAPPGRAPEREGGAGLSLPAPAVSYAQYLLYDDPPRPGTTEKEIWAGFQTGLRFTDGANEARLGRVPAAARGHTARTAGVADLGPRAPGQRRALRAARAPRRRIVRGGRSALRNRRRGLLRDPPPAAARRTASGRS